MNNTYYQEKLKTLPDNLQYAVIMSDWQKSLISIQSEHKLHVDQTQVLEDLIIKLMFGDIDAPDFINHMFNEAHISSEKAADILLEIDLKILKKIRERLEELQKKEEEDAILEEILIDEEEKQARIESDLYADLYEELENNINTEEEIPSDINKEKEDLLSEIDTPTKNILLNVDNEVDNEKEIIPVDHQIENIHVEKPFHEEDIIPEITETKTSTTPAMPIEIKKPISIKLDDIYREPIE